MEGSLRQFMREWFTGVLDDVERADLKVLSDQCVAEITGNHDLLESVIAELLRPMVYETGKMVLQASRRAMVEEERTPLTPTRPTRLMPIGEVAKQIERGSHRRDFRKWMEYEPRSGAYVSFLAMTKEECLAAAAYRESRTETDLRRAGLLRMAAGRLATGQRVDAVWTAKELEEIEAMLTVERPKYGMNGQTIFDLMRGVA